MTHLLKDVVADLTPELHGVSHRIHGRPELGGQEHFACGLLTELAHDAGFEVLRPAAGLDTAFVARKRLGESGGPAPRIAFLAEYDALPGLGHGCGHNWIAATSLGAALALGQAAEDLAGEVLLIGTPGEESFGGKVVLAEGGVFDDVDAVMMVHPSRRTRVDRSSLATCPVEVEFRGKRSHAASSPEEGVNALDATILLFVALDQVRRSLRDGTRTPGVIANGGEVPNVIPDRALARFSLRASDAAYVSYLRERLEECARGAAMATRCTVTTRLYEPQYLELRSNPVLVRLFRQQLERLGIAESPGESGGLGSLDIGNLSHLVPTIHPDLAIAPPTVGIHTEAFREAAVSKEADAMIPMAVEALAATGLRLLEDPRLVTESRALVDSKPEGDGG